MQTAAYPRKRRPGDFGYRPPVPIRPVRVRAIVYCRVSTDDQVRHGYGLEAQTAAVDEACDRRDWRIVERITEEGVSGKSLERPGLHKALRMLANNEADALVVAKLDRLSRSVVDFGVLLEWFNEADATLLALDLDVDTSTPGGRLVANVFASVAEWERETIAARTRDGLAALRARGKSIGRPAVVDQPELAARIRQMRETMTLQGIADALNAEGVPTVRGGSVWRPNAVAAACGYKRRKPMRKHPDLPLIPRGNDSRSRRR
jgi:DNA invertase Pin-like site-specific DNA recombinase